MARIVERGQPVDGAQITITTPRDGFGPGEPIHITIILKNLREHEDLHMYWQGSWQDYALNLSFSNQQPVPMTLYGKQIFEASRDILRVRSQSLSPGAATMLTIPINRLFDMSLADIYELFVSRPVERKDGRGSVDVISNSIAIEVSETVGEQIVPEQLI